MISVGTIILSLIIITFYLKYKYTDYIENMIVLTLFFEVLVIRGYYIKVGNFLIDYITVMHLFLFVVIGSFIYVNIKLVSKKYKIYIGILLFLQISTLIIEYFNPPMEYVIDNWDTFFVDSSDNQRAFNIYTHALDLLFIYLPSLLSVFLLKTYLGLNYLNANRVVSKVNKLIDVYLIILLVQAITVVIFNNNFIDGIFEILCGPGTEQTTEIRQRFSNINNIHGIAGESSFLAYSMYFTCLLYYVEYTFNLKRKIFFLRIFMSITYMLLSGAFSSVLFIFLLIVYTIKNTLKKKQIVLLVAVVVFLFIVLMPEFDELFEGGYFYYRFMLVFETFERIGDLNVYGVEDSSLVRFASVVFLINKVCEFNPILGLGMGVQGAHNGLAMLFADLGIIGSYIWYKIVTSNIEYAKIDFFLLIIVQNVFFGFKFYINFITILIIFFLEEVGKNKNERRQNI